MLKLAQQHLPEEVILIEEGYEEPVSGDSDYSHDEDSLHYEGRLVIYKGVLVSDVRGQVAIRLASDVRGQVTKILASDWLWRGLSESKIVDQICIYAI